MVALMELREGAAGEMRTTASPDFPWYVALIVTVPDVTAVTSPPEVTVAPTERACHVAVADTFCVAPSDKVAVAVSWTVWPMLVKSVEPFTATDDTVVDEGAMGDEGAMELDDEPPHDHETTSATRTRMRLGRFVPSKREMISFMLISASALRVTHTERGTLPALRAAARLASTSGRYDSNRSDESLRGLPGSSQVFPKAAVARIHFGPGRAGRR
jgi:hypothetical protein